MRSALPRRAVVRLVFRRRIDRILESGCELVLPAFAREGNQFVEAMLYDMTYMYVHQNGCHYEICGMVNHGL